MTGVWATVVLALLSCTPLHSQSVPPQREFEVASLKPFPKVPPAGIVHVGVSITGARVAIGMTRLSELIAMAYRVGTLQVSGPDWMAKEAFDVNAVMPTGASKSQLPEMLAALLEKRFNLVIHRDQKLLPVYGLVLAKGGFKARPPSGELGYPRCWTGDATQIGAVRRDCQDMTMAELADELPKMAGQYLDRPVVDLTGIKGEYDFSLEWVGRKRLDSGESGLTIFDSVFKYLGLKLEERQFLLPLVVIDHIDRTPAEN